MLDAFWRRFWEGKKEMKERKKERKGLIEVKRKPLFPGDDYLAQISLIVDIVGVPSAADLKFVEEGEKERNKQTNKED